MKIGLFGLTLAFGQVAFAQTNQLYENNFETTDVGKLPGDVLVLNGEFKVKADGTNKYLELPGAPLDTFALLFGPVEAANVAVSARIFGTAKGRRYPTFGVGLGGVAGHRLQISPGKKALELYRDQDLEATVPYDWKPGGWSFLRLQLRKVENGEWKIEGKAWAAGATEPSTALVEFIEKETPPTGRASISGCPFSGTPIRFDDLEIINAGEREVKPDSMAAH